MNVLEWNCYLFWMQNEWFMSKTILRRKFETENINLWWNYIEKRNEMKVLMKQEALKWLKMRINENNWKWMYVNMNEIQDRKREM